MLQRVPPGTLDQREIDLGRRIKSIWIGRRVGAAQMGFVCDANAGFTH